LRNVAPLLRADFGPEWTGFKMWKNGSFTPIGGPPGAFNTNPTSISDTGIVVGWHEGADPSHGFVLANGVYKTLDYPNAFRTSLNDINSPGVIVGSWINSDGNGGGFLFVNGKFKDVVAPGGQGTAVNGISNYGYVTGTSSAGSFIAHCQCNARVLLRQNLKLPPLPSCWASRWHEEIGDPTIAGSFLERLVHDAHRIEMRRESMRKKRNPPPDESDEKKD
jgi:hypothetical protein